jgi:carbonic anhydrase/acetyltransferase-like protein (isoleucine patch superfamily)
MSERVEPIGPPTIPASAFVHPRASVCGRATLGERASVWGGVVIRADTDVIVVGDESNIQDLTMLHTDRGIPVVIGDRVTVGHRAILHGCTVDNDVLIGMGAILLNRCRIGSGCARESGARDDGRGASKDCGIRCGVSAAGRRASPRRRVVPRRHVTELFLGAGWSVGARGGFWSLPGFTHLPGSSERNSDVFRNV